MNRYDWIVVGMCLYGIHLVVQGILAVFVVAATFSDTGFKDFGQSGMQNAGFLVAVLTSFIGSFLILLSLKIGVKLSGTSRPSHDDARTEA